MFDGADLKRQHCLLLACHAAIQFIKTVFGVTGLPTVCDVTDACFYTLLQILPAIQKDGIVVKECN